MLCKDWVIRKINKQHISDVSEKFDIDPFLAMMLSSRGLDSDDQILNVLNPSSDFSDAMSFIDMDKAVQRISRAIDSFEKICIYGDYDCDGVTSTALLYSYLDVREANVIYFMPDRHTEGYGLNVESIKKLKDQDVSLIITVDNGITAVKETEFAKELGIDIVITDHHKVPEKMPDAVAVVDPHRDDCACTFKDFSGVGVAFKLVCALEQDQSSVEDLLCEYSDLVALGTIADVVPLIDENRMLVQAGLENLTHPKRPGLRALMSVSGILDKEISSSNIAFSLAPRINASGRLCSANVAVQLLLSELDDQAEQLAEELNDLNVRRKQIEDEILNQVENFFKTNPSRLLDKVIVAEGSGFHQGVIGIVASRIVDKYSKPCLIISKDGDVSRGSGRSVEGFSLYDAVAIGKDYFLKFGGHPMAVGFDVPTEKIPQLVQDVNNFAQKLEHMPVPILFIDCKLRPDFLNLSMVDQLKTLEPFGTNNPTPLFGLFGMKIEKIEPICGDKHIKLSISKNKTTLTALKFAVSTKTFGFKKGDIVDLAVTIKKDVFRDVEQLSIFVKDIKLSGILPETINENARLYENIKNNNFPKQSALDVLPSRDEFAIVYRFLKSESGWNSSFQTLWFRLNDPKISPCKLDFILDIMEELTLINLKKSSCLYSITINTLDKKVDLKTSEIIKKLKLMGD